MQAEDLHGSWSLVRTYKLVDGAEVEPPSFNQDSYGYIHYLLDQRVAVVIAHARANLSGDRRGSPESEMAAAARSFDAYGGTFSVSGDVVTHHLDISSYENDRGTDYVRRAKLADDRLMLEIPEVVTTEGRVVLGLEWKRVRPN